jgi:DNA-binding transcriptional MerR regulator
MATQISPRQTPVLSEIPDKLYFRIGDVAEICQVPAYVLRFWESEFPQLKPNKSGTGQRLYRKRDVEISLRIKRLLYDEGYTIPGARQVFQAEAKESRNRAKTPELPLPVPTSNASAANIEKVRKELRELVGILSAPVGSTQRKRQERIARGPVGPGSGGLFEM